MDFRIISSSRFAPVLYYAVLVLITASCGVQEAAQDAVDAASSNASSSNLNLSVTVTSSLRSSTSGGGSSARIKRHLRSPSALASVGSNSGFAGMKFWASPAGTEVPDPAITDPTGTVGSDGSINTNGFAGKDTILMIEDPNAIGHYVKALVKSNADGTRIDPISFGQYDAAVSAGLDPEDSHFAGAGMAAALDKAAETAVISSGLDEKMAAVADDLEACGSASGEALATCAGSVVAGSTSLVSDIELAAVQTKGVSPVDVVRLVTRAGYAVSIDTFIFKKFGEQLATALNTDFVSGVREDLIAIAQRAADGLGATDTVQILCKGSYSAYMRGGSFSYVPSVVTDSGTGIPSLSCNNPDEIARNFGGSFSASSQQVIDYGNAADAGVGGHAIQLGSVDCNTNNGWQNQGYFCAWPARLVIKSKVSEVNRNDPEGEHPRGQGDDQDEVSFIDVSQKLMDDLMSDSQTTRCLADVNNGDPTLRTGVSGCQTWFTTFMSGHRQEFSGLVGFYMMLNNPNAYGGESKLKLSLQDIHDLFVGSAYLNNRLSAWGPGMTSRTYLANFTDENGNARSMNVWVNPLLKFVSGHFEIQALFKWNAPNPTDQQVNDAVAAASLPYDHTFKMFERIPSMDEIRSFVFGKAHHEEYNPSGSRYFWASGKQNTGKPVVCRMLSKASNKASSQELSSDSKLECLENVSLLAPDASDPALFTGAENYPYVLTGWGWRGDDKASPLRLTERRTGRPAQLGGDREVIILPIHPGNSETCKDPADADKIIKANMVFGMGDQQQQQSVKAYCADLSDFTVSGEVRLYWGGNVTIKGRDDSGRTWEWQSPQVGGVDPAQISVGVRPICYFAASGSLSTTNGLTSLGNGATHDGNGLLTSIGTGDVVAPCAESQAGKTKYNLVMMGSGSSSSNRNDLRAYLLSTGDSPQNLAYRYWQQGDSRWEDQLFKIAPDLLEESGLKVAPASAPTFLPNLQVRNVKHDPKFDPYCDDRNGNGKCDCNDPVTHAAKNPDSCTLEDEAAEPTLSQPLWWPGQDHLAEVLAFFHDYGGKSGAGLAGIDGGYIHDHHIFIPLDQAFSCKFQDVNGVLRKPAMFHWEDFSRNHEGCPASDGGVVTAGVEGPIQLLNPVAANNAYDVEFPQTFMGLIGMATAQTGVGVSVARTDKVFSIDAALALIKVRSLLPTDAPIYDSNGTTRVYGMYPQYVRMMTPGAHNMNSLSAVQKKIKSQ
ncbi:MAG: hypothetical protein EBX52_00340 [Proteobacteria bacterium]|nr:hypothetical protein [Pseudomonadota bacterium]